MIKLSNGYGFTFMTASGALGFDGEGYVYDWPFIKRGWLDRRQFLIVLKTITREPRVGNRRWYDWLGRGCVRFLPDGLVNAVGLTNPGIEHWCQAVAPRLADPRLRLVFSLQGTPDEVAQIAEHLAGAISQRHLTNIKAVELNASCPNVQSGMGHIGEIWRSLFALQNTLSTLPRLLKISAAHEPDLAELVRVADDLVEAYSLNSVPWAMAFPGEPSPFERYNGWGQGGVSGRAAQRVNWRIIQELRILTKRPVTGSGPWSYNDVVKLLNCYKVGAVSFGAIHLPNPLKPWTWGRPAYPTHWVKCWQRENSDSKTKGEKSDH